MRYQAFARAIGLMAHGEAWSAWYRTQTQNILVVMAAVERYGGRGTSQLKFENIVTDKGQPGAGFAKESRIKRSKSG
jgi:hypothetical protein